MSLRSAFNSSTCFCNSALLLPSASRLVEGSDAICFLWCRTPHNGISCPHPCTCGHTEIDLSPFLYDPASFLLKRTFQGQRVMVKGEGHHTEPSPIELASCAEIFVSSCAVFLSPFESLARLEV
ncbi:hypothetical protein LIER_32941 [Lithospermum erythrorhizon]|uniref:Uncharacterized protein n=1 Tax=Lithospermum erythrorhizon TaxID=34254 RepID=A0AAV3RV95_LITER